MYCCITNTTDNNKQSCLRSNPVKKRLYDAYASDVDTEKPEGMSYAEWESRQVEIPQWLERILRIPGGGIWWVAHATAVQHGHALTC